jgi:hypothetical protein
MRLQYFMAQMVALVVTAVWSLSVPALAQDCPALVGYIPGSAHWLSPVAVSGGYAYLGSTVGLVVADVSNPSTPWTVGEVGLPGEAQGIAVAENYAYVATCVGLVVIDLSTPSAPVQVGFVGTFNAQDVAMSGGYAYVTSTGPPSGLRVIDVSTPSAPAQVGFLEGATGRVAVSGGHAHLAAGWAGLHVIDVTTPSTPVEVGSLATGYAVDVAVSGGYAYVAGLRFLSVIDVSLPSSPVEVGSIGIPGDAGGVAVSGGYAYFTVPQLGLRVIEVSTPSSPVEVGLANTPGHALDVAVSGNHAYVTGEQVTVFDVSTPSTPIQVGAVSQLSLNPWGVAASGGYAYVVWLDNLFFEVLDMSTPSAPVDVGSVFLPGGGGFAHLADVAVLDGHAYAATGGSHDDLGGRTHSHLVVIDVNTPSAPVDVGMVEWWPGPRPRAVAASDGYAYLASGGSGVVVIDVSTPAAPVEVGSIGTPGSALDVAVSGDYAYVTWTDDAGKGGLRVIDVSTPSAPVEVGFVDRPGAASCVAVAGGYAYVGGDGISVIDVSTPSAPVEFGFVETPGYAHDVAVSDEFVYVTVGAWPKDSGPGEGDRSLRVIDVSTPSAPVEIGFHEALPTAQNEWDLGDVAISDEYVYFAAGSAGLYIFSECRRGPTADPRECFIPAAAVAAGAQGAFFQTDVEVNNTGTEEAEVSFQWLPRGEDNSEPVASEPISLAPGQSLRYENVLAELFGLGPDSLGALKLVASTESVIGMSRTYNIPAGETAGTFGQGLPAIRATEMIMGTEPQRIIFLSENDDSRANVGCVNGSSEPVTISIGVFDDEGSWLETRTMDLGPYSNNQINRIFEDYAPVNGYVDVWADSDDALYYCYGSMLDNSTSDPTTILPQVPSADMSFIPAAALAAGLEGAFFQTDVDLNNVGSTDLTYRLAWLPRGEDNSEAVHSDTFSLAPGAGVRYANVLNEVFGLDPDQVGALAIEANGADLLAMSRTYNLPSAKVAGTFGQELPGIPADKMISTGVTKRIIFMNENDDVRANVGCVNGAGAEVAVAVELYDSDGALLETKYMMLPPYSNRQINGIFQDYAPINGYVDVRTYTPDASIYCYGSVLDNLTSDPTTVLPQ